MKSIILIVIAGLMLTSCINTGKYGTLHIAYQTCQGEKKQTELNGYYQGAGVYIDHNGLLFVGSRIMASNICSIDVIKFNIQ